MSSQQFSKNRRLLKRVDFEQVFSASRSRGSLGGSIRKACFVVYWKQTQSTSRLGLSIPRRVIKSAVKRNRIKRQIREYFRKLPEACQGDFIVRLIHPPKMKAASNLTSELDSLKSLLKRNSQASCYDKS